jgi:prepilin-type N-terminal cleavage/methylation domain-containing protein/prepilin-type processing-associated H-X9-DG protein
VVKISIEDTLAEQGNTLESKLGFFKTTRNRIEESWHNALDRIHSYVRPEKYKGFTLIELLVAISMITVLTGIILVGIKGARNRAREATCLGNIRNLGIAWLAYNGDNDGRMICGYPGANSSWVDVPMGKGNGTEREKEGIKRGLLFPYISDVEVYRCGADKRKWTTGAFRSYSIAGGMNGVSPKGEDEIYPIQMTKDITTPANQYVFVEEADPRAYNQSSYVLHPVSREWADPVAVWHNTSLAFADGHVEAHKWKAKSFVDWCRTAYTAPNTFIFKRSPVQESEDFDFMFKGYAYKALKE